MGGPHIGECSDLHPREWHLPQNVTTVNVILSLDADITVRVIELGFVQIYDSLEIDNYSERVNKDMLALSGMLKEIFSRQELWDANTNISSIVEDKTLAESLLKTSQAALHTP